MDSNYLKSTSEQILNFVKPTQWQWQLQWLQWHCWDNQIMMRALWKMMKSDLHSAILRRASSVSSAAFSTAATCPININNHDNGSSAADINDLITVWIMSINDVNDLTKLPRWGVVDHPYVSYYHHTLVDSQSCLRVVNNDVGQSTAKFELGNHVYDLRN